MTLDEDIPLGVVLDGFTRRDWQDAKIDGTIRFAMVGLGWWTRAEAIPAVEQSEYCETTVIVSGSEEKAREVAQSTDSIDHALSYDQFHDGVASDAYDAVYICTPNALHLPMVETSARFGKDVLCEKPMETSVDRAETMVSLCQDANATLMIAYRMQTEPAVRRACELIDKGVIGDPVLVHGNMSQPLLDEVIPDPDQWRLNPVLSGSATVADIGLYPLNTTRYILNEDPVCVWAEMSYQEEAFAESGDEHVSFGLTFPGGVHAVCTASQSAYQSSHFRITGTKGEIEIDPAFFNRQDRSFHLSRGGHTVDIDFEQTNQMVEEFDYFAYCLLSGRNPYPDGTHGLADMHVIEAILEAADRGTTVRLDL